MTKIFRNNNTNRKIVRNNRKIYNPSIVLGNYTAQGLCLPEAQIDNLVLRVSLQDYKKSPEINNVLKKPRVRSKQKKKGGSNIPPIITRRSKARNQFMTRLGLRENKECTNVKEMKPVLQKFKSKRLKLKASKDLKNTLKKNLSSIIDSPTNNGVFSSSEELVEERTKIIRKTPRTTIPKYKKLQSNQRHYFLQLPTSTPGEESRNNYDFHQLMNSLQYMKLPASDWKIKVMLRQKNVYSIVITNCQVFERSLTFYAQSVLYNIMIDNLAVVLIGSPKTVDSLEDIEVLLDIIQHINLSDPMVKIK